MRGQLFVTWIEDQARIQSIRPHSQGRQSDRAEVHNGHVQNSNAQPLVFRAENCCDPQVISAQRWCLLLQLLEAGRLLLRTVGKSTGERIRSARVVLGDSEGQSHRVNPTLSPGPQPQVSCKKLKVRHVAAGDRTQLKRLKFCEHTTDRSLHTLYLPAGPAHEMKESG